MRNNLTIDLAVELTELETDSLAQEDIQQVRKLLLDHVVVAMVEGAAIVRQKLS